MNHRIIYPTDDGGVAVIVPAPECELTIEQNKYLKGIYACFSK